jgi:YD repeat-containing protein
LILPGHHVGQWAGNRTGIIDALGRTTTSEFDARNRLIGVLDPLNQRTRYRYDAVGNLLSTSNPLNETTTYSYDLLHRQISVTDPNGQITRSTYDANDNLLSLTDPLGNRTSYTYDRLNRLTRDTNALNHSRSYSYDAVDNPIGMTDRNGRRTRYIYDNLDRLVTEDWLNSTGTSTRTITRTYDTGSRLTQITDPAATYRCAYDVADQVVNVDTNGSPELPNVAILSGYDAVGNRAKWNYKERAPQYENFRNFNYGAIGAAAGFSR